MARLNKSVRVWLHGLAAAVVGAAANAVTLLIVDPATFHDWGKLGQFCGVNAVIAAALYLRKSPLPGGTEAKK